MKTEIKECTRNELQLLQNIGRETFYETFHHLNTAENMENYLHTAFSLEKLEKEVSNPSSSFYIICINDETAGYLKINIDDAQTDQIGEDALEVERIYIRKPFQGAGLGRNLINKAIVLAKSIHKKQIWLGVWEINYGAIEFYKKMGFAAVGTHIFTMGDEPQTDLIMVKTL